MPHWAEVPCPILCGSSPNLECSVATTGAAYRDRVVGPRGSVPSSGRICTALGSLFGSETQSVPWATKHSYDKSPRKECGWVESQPGEGIQQAFQGSASPGNGHFLKLGETEAHRLHYFMVCHSHDLSLGSLCQVHALQHAKMPALQRSGRGLSTAFWQ